MSESNAVTAGGYTLDYSGYAAAQKGILHAEASYSIGGPNPCTVTGCDYLPAGVSATAAYQENNVKAVAVGSPDLLAGITAYKVTFDLHGTISPIINTDNAALYAWVFQGPGGYYDGKQVYTSSFTAFGDPAGPESLYLQPPALDQPFDVDFVLVANAYWQPAFFDHGTVDFSDTASLASFEAINANGDVVPGIELQLSDGSLLGPDGFTSPTAATPEPSSLILLCSGLIGAAGAVRRRLPA